MTLKPRLLMKMVYFYFTQRKLDSEKEFKSIWRFSLVFQWVVFWTTPMVPLPLTAFDKRILIFEKKKLI